MLVYLTVVVIALLTIYVCMLFWENTKGKEKNRKIRTLIVIGSGGHTAEMLRLISRLTRQYQPRLYIMADSDTTSQVKVVNTEASLQFGQFEIKKIPRSRKVGQSYFTSIFSTLYSVICSILPVLAFKPELVLVNGPGTCIPVCLIAYIASKILRWKTKIIFVESICRVRTLSLTGKILLYIADFVVVQWPVLQQKYPSTVFLGRLF